LIYPVFSFLRKQESPGFFYVEWGDSRFHGNERGMGGMKNGIRISDFLLYRKSMIGSSHPKIAIVADWLTNYGGAESVVSAFHALFPEAPIYTTLYKPKAMRELGHLKNIHTSWLQKIPLVKHQWLLAQMPLAVEQFNLDKFDVVLSSCHSVAKGIITKPETLHISYCHTPMRYAWENWDLDTRIKRFPRILHPAIRHQMKKIREWDYCAAQRVDEYLANSGRRQFSWDCVLVCNHFVISP